MTIESLPKAYDARPVEEKYARWWLEKGYFHALNPGDAEFSLKPFKGPFCIVIPPPNVTNPLHMGHALDLTIQDVLTRWRRMQGYDTLWLPGTDHAGIATQNIVERRLGGKGITRHDLGREKFVEEVWRWKEEAHSRITGQLKRLGASCDWSRERFTLDEGCSRSVRHAFSELHREGLIYRGERMINWCPRCATALSDIEVEHKQVEGKLYYLRYPLEVPPQGRAEPAYLVVATTRPETMLGDTAVAANPRDERHGSLTGRAAILPLVGRRLTIIFDEAVQPDFGTGLVKITPAHDPDDFEIGHKHGLALEVVIGPDAKMNENAGKYAGLDRYQARERILEDLEQLGLVEKVEPYAHSVGHCYRCDMAIEPMVSLQWFVKMEPLARLGEETVKSGKVRFVPQRWEKVYLDWLANIRDWCISRQLWWGHRIPVWYCQGCGQENAAEEEPKTCGRCGSQELVQDEDVLDTWFSSALWPFSTLGWPDKTPDLEYFYPTSVLVTGYDIIYFWVARMIMMGMKLMGREPFKEVWIHGLVRDPKGRKMSKSEGNVVDPLEIVDKYSADALRFALASASALGQDLRLTEERLVGARNFCNKIWNAARFVLNASANQPAASWQKMELKPTSEWALEERWIMSRLQDAVAKVTKALEDYRLDEACTAAYQFLWNDFCDWYLEISKSSLGDPSIAPAAIRTLRHCLRTAIRLLHPIIPFITEEVWQRLNETEPGCIEAESISIAPWPEVDDPWLLDDEQTRPMEHAMRIAVAARGHRKNIGLPASLPYEILVDTANFAGSPSEREGTEGMLKSERMREWFPAVTGHGYPIFRLDNDAPYFHAPWVTEGPAGIKIGIKPPDGVDLVGEWEAQVERLRKELENAEAELARTEAKLEDQHFLTRAKPQVVAKERNKESEFRQKVESIRQRIKELEEFLNQTR